MMSSSVYLLGTLTATGSVSILPANAVLFFGSGVLLHAG